MKLQSYFQRFSGLLFRINFCGTYYYLIYNQFFTQALYCFYFSLDTVKSIFLFISHFFFLKLTTRVVIFFKTLNSEFPSPFAVWGGPVHSKVLTRETKSLPVVSNSNNGCVDNWGSYVLLPLQLCHFLSYSLIWPMNVNMDSMILNDTFL